MEKSIRLLSHASVIVHIDNICILTDPWFLGTAFNDGWELFPSPKLEDINSSLKHVNLIWISHEHPDHLHFPTLKYIKDYLSDDVKIVFQSSNSTKVFDSLKKIGYSNFFNLAHMQRRALNGRIEIAVYSHRHLDSALAIFIDGKLWTLNINDTELNETDTRIIRKTWGEPTVILNQFSIAGSEGIEGKLRDDSDAVLEKMIDHHKQLGATITIPFASFIRFSRIDNSYLNGYINTPLDAEDKFKKNDFDLILLYPQGLDLVWNNEDIYPSNHKEVRENAKKELVALFGLGEESIDHFEMVSYKTDQVNSAVISRIIKLKNRTSPLVWKQLKPIIFKVIDWNHEHWKLDFQRCAFIKVPSHHDYDIELNSQPLEYAFKLPFGVQTLGVSGRYRFNKIHTAVPKTWKIFRILTSLENVEIYISFKSIFSLSLWKWVWLRKRGLLNQVKQQLNRFT